MLGGPGERRAATEAPRETAAPAHGLAVELGPTLAEAEATARRRRRRRRLVLWTAVLWVPALAYLALVGAAYSGALDSLDRAALARGLFVSADAVARARAEAADSARAEAAPPPEPSPALERSVQGWVDLINQTNGPAVAYLGMDGYGNLYVAMSLRYAAMPPRDQMQVLDRLGSAYRAFLASVLGSIPNSRAFAPGILVLDTLGLHAENRNGAVKWYRAYDQPGPVAPAPGEAPPAGLPLAPSVAAPRP